MKIFLFDLFGEHLCSLLRLFQAALLRLLAKFNSFVNLCNLVQFVLESRRFLDDTQILINALGVSQD